MIIQALLLGLAGLLVALGALFLGTIGSFLLGLFRQGVQGEDPINVD